MLSADDKLKVLLETARVVQSVHEIEKILPALSETAKKVISADRCSIFMYDEKKDELWSVLADGVDEIRTCAKKGTIGHATNSKDIQIVVDAYNDYRFNKEIDANTGYITKNIISVPLLRQDGTVLGVFQALNKEEGDFNHYDAELLLLIANYAAAYLENALLIKKLRQTQQGVIQRLSTAAEFKDEETSKHTKRVGLYAAMLGKKLNMNAYDIDKLLIAAPMHDVGKIGIEDAILKKPGKLNDLEFTRMREHASIGFDILNDEEDDYLKTAALIANEHHEKYNGKGYPKGLKGEEISIFGRITAIVDVFDALTSVRPYKKAWSNEDAFALIEEELGEHFDPHIGKLFLDNRAEVLKIKEENRD
jgi:HD-GYP domain-containing protein (c-di-GMP phosphodiesterase class II)